MPGACPWESTFIPILKAMTRLGSHCLRFDPTGKSLIGPLLGLSSPLRKNILIFRRRKSPYIRRRPAPLEGRCATSRNAERDAVDADAL
jgi:hypothetical protein